MKHRSRLSLGLAVFLAGLLVVVSAATVFAGLTPPGSVEQNSWDPSTGGSSPKWTNGGNAGYWEGETAVMVAEIVNEQGTTYDLPICLQVWEEPSPPTKAYGFVGFAPFDTTTRGSNLPPPALPGGEDITGFPAGPWDTGDANVYGYNITINSVSAPALGLPNCYANEIGVVVNYTPQADSGAYILWGGRIAKAGDATPAGSPDAVVPVGKSAGYTTGVFQARLRTASADKTLPFKVQFGPNAIALSSFQAAAAAPAGLALVAALGGLSAAGLLLRRRRR